MVGRHHRLNGHEFEQLQELVMDTKPGVLQSIGLQRVRHDWTSLHFMVFPVVMYECESWTIKKTEH